MTQITKTRPAWRAVPCISFVLSIGLLAISARAQQTPTILLQPDNQTNPPGFTVNFGVGTQSSYPVTYQWLLNGQPVGGAGYVISNEALSVVTAEPTNTGPYTVTASNIYGVSTSAPVSITLTNAAVQTPNIRYTAVASLDYFTTGAFPQTGVIQGADGFLYGVALRGGANGDGAIYKMSTNGSVAWTFPFNLANGYSPVAGLVQDTNGMFYGTTAGGGLNGVGTVYSISPAGAFKLLYSFTNDTDGGLPQAALCIGSDGYLYGDTSTNGAGNLGGTVFKMDTNGTLLWASLLTTNTGDVPLAALVQGPDGNFYGTASADGSNDFGSIFRVTPAGAVTNIYSFTGNSDGGTPYGALVVGNDGLLYGVTSTGGAEDNGAIFKISTNGTLTALYSFDGTNGISPEAALFLARDGNFYGTTVSGGIEYELNYGANYQLPSGYPYGFGTIFQMTPAGAVTAMISFNGNSTGAYSHSSLWQGTDGGLYGTTANGGTNGLTAGGYGLVFRLSIPAPQISSAARHGSVFSFDWDSVVGELYQVQYKDALSQPQWMDLNAPLAGTNGVAGASDNITTNQNRFYRVILQ